MKKTKVTFAVVLSTAVVAALGANLGSAFGSGLYASECEHNGNHYAANSATCQVAGNKEFWACCLCNQQFLAAPAKGTWKDVAAPASELESTHIAYLATVDHAYGPSTRAIGHYDCSMCGAQTANVMTTEEISSFSSKPYGISGRYVDGTMDNDARNNGMTFVGSVAYGPNIVLPKIDYSLYESVSFAYCIDHYNADSLKADLYVGHETTDTELATWSFLKGSQPGAIRVYNCESYLKLEILKPGASGATKTVNVTDAEILNGTKNLELYMVAPSGRTFYLNSVSLNQKETRISPANINNGSQTSSLITPNDAEETTVGGVKGVYKKFSLAEAEKSYAIIDLQFAEVAKTEKIASVKMYIECESTSETKSNIIVRDHVMTGYSADNPNWCILNTSVAHNQWVTVSFPAERLVHDDVITDIKFYANGASAARNFYIESVSFSQVGSLAIVNNKTVINSSQNTCSGGTSNLGNSFTSVKAVSNPNGYVGEATKCSIGASCTYVLDRFDLVNPIDLKGCTKITFKLYYECDTTPSSGMNVILCPNNGTASSNQQTIQTTQVNQWLDVTFTNAQSCAVDGILYNLNFGTWSGGWVANTNLYIASITIA